MNSRKIIVEILNSVFYKASYSNIEINKRLNNSSLDIRDRGLVTEIVYGTIRYRKKIDFIISNYVKDIRLVDKTILNILRSTIYQILFLSKVPDYAAVNEAVNLAKTVSKSSSGFVNGVLRNILRNNDKNYISSLNGKKLLAVKYSFPNWMVELFINQYGAHKAEEIMKNLNETPNITVRVNSLKSDYDDIMEKLEEHGYNVEEGAICPEAIKINKGSSIEHNDLFKEGYITVQDESAMLTAQILDLDENMNVIDLCSAPGGKATHIGEIMNNTGNVIACDIYEHKIKLINDNCTRLGITDVNAVVNDAAVINNDFINSADRVLVDVPCSGLGIIRKKPEIKWNKTKKSLDELCTIQRNIMENAWKYLKNDGIMVYSTCTINKNENEKNIDWFIDTHQDAEIEKIFVGQLDNVIYNDNNTVTILPNKDMDGFFLARIRKKGRC